MIGALVRALLLGVLPAAVSALPPPERVRFDSLDTQEGAPVQIQGLLFVPPAPVPAGGRAAVVALHGCGGMYSASRSRAGQLSERHAAHAEALLAAGYAVLFPDSFGSRGAREVCTVPLTQRSIRPPQRRLDALGALAWLAAQADVDPARIALLGWSHGGSTVLAAVNAGDAQVAASRTSRSPPLFFRTAVAFYPGCTAALREPRWEPATPLAILIGAADDWTPASACESLGARGKARAWPLEVVVYPDAHHGFDAPGDGSVRHRRDVPSGVRPGEGVHVGPHPPSREAANARLAAILAQALAP